MHEQHTASTISAERVRRLRELLAMMTGRDGDDGPLVATRRRNLAQAEAALTEPATPDDGEARRP